MSKKLFGGGKKAAAPAVAAPEAKGPIVTPLGGIMADTIARRRGRSLPPTIVGPTLNSTLGGG